MSDLDRLRVEIDKCDDIIARAYEKRLQLVDEVAAFKKINNIQILNSGREAEVLKRVCADSVKYKDDIERLYLYIMNYSRIKQDILIK